MSFLWVGQSPQLKNEECGISVTSVQCNGFVKLPLCLQDQGRVDHASSWSPFHMQRYSARAISRKEGYNHRRSFSRTKTLHNHSTCITSHSLPSVPLKNSCHFGTKVDISSTSSTRHESFTTRNTTTRSPCVMTSWSTRSTSSFNIGNPFSSDALEVAGLLTSAESALKERNDFLEASVRAWPRSEEDAKAFCVTDANLWVWVVASADAIGLPPLCDRWPSPSIPVLRFAKSPPSFRFSTRLSLWIIVVLRLKKEVIWSCNQASNHSTQLTKAEIASGSTLSVIFKPFLIDTSLTSLIKSWSTGSVNNHEWLTDNDNDNGTNPGIAFWIIGGHPGGRADSSPETDDTHQQLRTWSIQIAKRQSL
jgi:hypothetical protein